MIIGYADLRLTSSSGVPENANEEFVNLRRVKSKPGSCPVITHPTIAPQMLLNPTILIVPIKF